MSTNSMNTLRQIWRNHRATVEQAKGPRLQPNASLAERQRAVEKRLHLLEQHAWST